MKREKVEVRVIGDGEPKIIKRVLTIYGGNRTRRFSVITYKRKKFITHRHSGMHEIYYNKLGDL
jgi:hypothetical protein